MSQWVPKERKARTRRVRATTSAPGSATTFSSPTPSVSAHAAAAVRNLLGMEFHHIETDWIVNMVRREGVPLFENGLEAVAGLGEGAVELQVDRDRQIPQQIHVGVR